MKNAPEKVEIEPVAIHTIGPADLDAVTQLVEQVSAQHVLPLLNEQGQKYYQEQVLTDLKTAFDPQHFTAIKAELKGQLVGFAALRDGNYLTHLFVDNDTQGAGVGSCMLRFLLQTTNATSIQLRSSVNAVGFYRHHGFIATGEEAVFNGIRFVPMCLTPNEA